MLQAICNDKCFFTDIYFGEVVGSMHDNGIFIRSPVGNLLKIMQTSICVLMGILETQGIHYQ